MVRWASVLSRDEAGASRVCGNGETDIQQLAGGSCGEGGGERGDGEREVEEGGGGESAEDYVAGEGSEGGGFEVGWEVRCIGTCADVGI